MPRNYKEFNYTTCCIESDGQSIQKMVDAAKSITYRTALHNMNGLLIWARAHGYEPRAPGLTLKHDWHVSFHKSVYQEQPCYYIRWSSIEFIWLRNHAARLGWGYGESNER